MTAGGGIMLHYARALSRREALERLGRVSAALGGVLASPALGRAERAAYPLGYSLYGMQSIPHLEALGHVARIGYPTIELCLRPGWDTEPGLLSRADRAEIRRRISDLGLELVSVMEGMRPAAPQTTVASNLERLRAAAEVAHECSPGAAVVIQSPLGGSPGSFAERREAIAEELALWARALEALDVTFCIKAHSLQAMSHPEHLVWMVEQVNSPRLKAVYDYSHFAAFGLDMTATIRQVAPHMGFVHVKDTIRSAWHPITGSCCPAMATSTTGRSCRP
jgi:sugar phosphate isomerase/epimerase